jgi:hypothetical protein
MGNQGSRLEIAVNRPVCRFAIDQRNFESCSGLARFISGRRDVDGRRGRFGHRVDPRSRFTYSVPQGALAGERASRLSVARWSLPRCARGGTGLIGHGPQHWK